MSKAESDNSPVDYEKLLAGASTSWTVEARRDPWRSPAFAGSKMRAIEACLTAPESPCAVVLPNGLPKRFLLHSLAEQLLQMDPSKELIELDLGLLHPSQKSDPPTWEACRKRLVIKGQIPVVDNSDIRYSQQLLNAAHVELPSCLICHDQTGWRGMWSTNEWRPLTRFQVIHLTFDDLRRPAIYCWLQYMANEVSRHHRVTFEPAVLQAIDQLVHGTSRESQHILARDVFDLAAAETRMQADEQYAEQIARLEASIVHAASEKQRLLEANNSSAAQLADEAIANSTRFLEHARLRQPDVPLTVKMIRRAATMLSREEHGVTLHEVL